MICSSLVNDENLAGGGSLGVFYNLPMSEYLAHPGLGSSILKKILLTPADFKAALSIPQNDTKATLLGTAIHTAVLEPHIFDEVYALQPECWGPKNKGEGKKKWDKFKKDNAQKNCIAWDEAVLVNRVISAARNHKALTSILEKSKTEVTAICNYKGHLLKGRADCLTNDGFIWDVKTTSKPLDDLSLARTVFNGGYHFQAAHHMLAFNNAGVNIKGFGWIFISTGTPAVHIVIKKAARDVLEKGIFDHASALETLENCQASNNWHGFDDDNVTELNFLEYIDRAYNELHTSQTFAEFGPSYLKL